MTLGEVRTMFLSLLNRDDCSATKADEFFVLALGRIQRELRAPMMERVAFADATTFALSTFTLPSDYLEGIDVLCDGAPLNKTSYRGLGRIPVEAAAPPTVYARYGNLLYFRGPIPVGSRVELLYYGEFTAFTSDTDVNELTVSAPDLLVYCALSYAGDFFVHESRDGWEARYQSILMSLNEQARADEFAGGSLAVQSAYPGA